MLKRKILDILFWILLIIGIILLLWYIFGNSPTELAITITFILTLLLKVWSISDNLNNFQYKTILSFHKIREDINKTKEEINNIENKVNKIESKFTVLLKNKSKNK